MLLLVFLKPSVQIHSKEPRLFTQSELVVHWAVPCAHSSVSEMISKKLLQTHICEPDTFVLRHLKYSLCPGNESNHIFHYCVSGLHGNCTTAACAFDNLFWALYRERCKRLVHFSTAKSKELYMPPLPK